MSEKKNKAGRRRNSQVAARPAARSLPSGPLLLTRLLALLGLGIGAYLSVLHYQAEGLVTSHFCQPGSVIDCTSVLNSTYASLFDVPVAVWATAAYAVTLVLAFIPQALALLFVCSWLAVFGLYMAAVSFFQLQSVCLFCSALYVVNIGLFVGALMLARSSADFEPGQFALGLLGCVILVGGIGWWQAGQARTELTQLDFIAPSAERMDRSFIRYYNQQREVAVRSQERHVKGEPDAPLRITEFVDFRCPSCAVARDYLASLHDANKGAVRIVFHHYPLDQACNPINQQVHPSSCAASIASECASEQDAFWDYADRLFANQKRFSRADLVGHAEALDLDIEQFDTCLDDPRMEERVRRDVEEGRRLEISATPTLIVNGRVIEGLPPPKKLATLVTMQRQQ